MRRVEVNRRSRYWGIHCSSCHKKPEAGHEILGTTLYVDDGGNATHRKPGDRIATETRLVYHRTCLIEILDLVAESDVDFEAFRERAIKRIERRQASLGAS